MIESVQLRQRGAYEFESHYDNLCAMQDSCPLPAVKAHLSQAVLDINGDRVRVNDWAPILNTLRINKSLEFIAVRSYYTPPSDENEKKTLIEKRKMPSIRSKEITYRLCKALKECLMCTPNLSCLEIQGLPLRERDLQTLMKGLAKNNTLHHLSLEFCRIGDSGLEVVCKGIKNSTAISSINLTGCSLSNKGAESLSKIIKHQAMKRHNEAWRDSLRYRRPDLDRMPGIRRITINNNPMLGDQGASLLAEALKDDLWLKALDMQSCGISTSGAKQLLDVLKYNTTVVVLDVRRNPLIDRDVVHSIMEQLMINCNGQDTEYKWIKGDEGLNGVKGKSAKKRTKTLNSSFGRKTTIRVSSGAQRRRTKSAGAVGVTRRIQPISSEDIKSGPGMPWRTALRANRYRGYPPEHIHGKMSQYENSEGSLLTSPDQTQSFLMREEDEDEDTLRELQRIKLDDSNLDTGVANVKDLQIELIQMRRKMQQEHLCRARSDKKIVELTLENKRLREDIARQKLEGGGNALDDESVLETIEASFKQFHEFLDLLREAGLGQLITMAGLDHKDSPFTQALPMAQRNSQRSLYATSPSKIPPRPVKPTFKTSSYCGDISSSGKIGESASPFDKKLREFQGGSYLADNSDFSHPANISDPTMVGEFEESNKGPMRKDELYDKILHETSGMFSHIDDQNVLARDYTQSKDPSKSESPKAANTWSPVLDKQTKERSPKSDRGRESIMSGTEEHSIGLREEIVHDLDDIDKSEKDMSEPPSKPKPQPRARKVSEEESFKDRKGKLAKDDSEKESPEHKSRLSDYNYSMESFDHSYMSEREEVIHLEQDLDLYGEPLSPPAQVINSDEEDF